MEKAVRTTQELMTLKEIAALTKRKVPSWRKDIRKRRVPYVRIGRQIRVPREFIEQMIAEGWRDPINL